MSHFDNLPYVFELARALNGKSGDNQKFSMKYDEYPTYVKKFEELSDEDRAKIIEKVKTRSNVDSTCGSATTTTKRPHIRPRRDGLSVNDKNNV